MLRVCLPHQHEARTYSIFSQTGPSRRIVVLTPLWKYSVFSKGTTINRPVQEPNRVSTTLRFFQMSCTADSWDFSFKKYLSQGHSSYMPSVSIELASLRLLYGD